MNGLCAKPSGCVGCPRHERSIGYVPPVGAGASGVLVVGGEPTKPDIQCGEAFGPGSQGGAILRRAISSIGMDLEQFTITHLVRCNARPATRAEIEECSARHLRRLVEETRPRAVVALGAEALAHLTGMAGEKLGPQQVRGYVVSGRGPVEGLPLVPALDPIFIREGAMNLFGTLRHDLQQAVEVARDGWHPTKQEYLLHPTFAEAREFLREARAHSGPIAVDIETNFSTKQEDEGELRAASDQITQVQFSLRPRVAIALPWAGEDYRQVAREVLALPMVKLTYNGLTFDLPILARNGYGIQGPVEDLMWMWHHLEPDLPKALGFAASFFVGKEMGPWKHRAQEDLADYGCADVDVLQRMYPQLQEALRRERLSESYDKFIRRLWPVLDAASVRGMPVDSARRAEFSAWLESESRRTFLEVQEKVPIHLRPVHSKAGNKTEPKEKGGKFRRTPGGEWEHYLEGYDLWLPVVARDFVQEDGRMATRWFRIRPFLVSSGVQMAAYLKDHYPKVGVPPHFDKKELAGLAKRTGDPLFTLAVRLRELEKMHGTYIEGWRLDGEGRAHTTFHFNPASGQIGSREPNIQNVPKGGDLATRFRQIIRARGGHRLVEVDYTGFHAVMTGFFANDAQYTRLASMGVHDYLAAHILKLDGVGRWLELSDKELAERLSWVKKNHKQVRDKVAKPVCHGVNFGLGVHKLYALNPENFVSLAEARAVRTIFERLFPKIFRWQEEVKLLAHTQGFLRTPHGCVRRFWDVYRVENEQLKSSSQAEEALAFLPSNAAHCHIKEAMLRMEEKGYLERYGLVNFVHDSCLFECPRELVDECVHNIRTEMEEPSDVLKSAEVAPDGLVVKTEASVGQDWAEMEVYKEGS